MNELAIEIIRRKYAQRQEYLTQLKLAGYTQARIAKEAGATDSEVSRYFHGTINSRKVNSTVLRLIEELQPSLTQSTAVR